MAPSTITPSLPISVANQKAPATSLPFDNAKTSTLPSVSTINVHAWIQQKYTPYTGDHSFLAPATQRTLAVWKRCEELLKRELATEGCLDVDAKTPSTITSHPPGFIDKDNEVIFGLQTDAPLKRAIKPKGGYNMVKAALHAHNHETDPLVEEIYTNHRKTHNDAVFDIYTPEMRAARSNHIITGLPDGYGRGRIIGDYRRVALYGTDALIAAKQADKLALGSHMTESVMRVREEVSEQIRALRALQTMARSYGFDISTPATNAREACQWTYFAYLAAVKEQDGAAMSLGRVDAFLDVYFEKDIAAGALTEIEAQEIIDQFVIKLRLVRHLRTKEYDELFAGDPTWVTAVLGGIGLDGRPLVTKTSMRFLHTLYNLGPAPEPNMTVLYDPNLPKAFRDYVSKVSIDTSSIQMESDALMRQHFGDDYAIACCVSAMRVGKDQQYFGARCNLAKLMLYVLNRGRDEITGKQVAPDFGPVPDGPIDFDWFYKTFDKAMDWLADLYVNTMNAIHYSHDKYCYEALQMSLHDTEVRRLMAFGIAGLSIVADSLSAIKYACVTPIRDPKTGLTTWFDIQGNFPKYGNDDDRVDVFAAETPRAFWEKLRKTPAYRDAVHTLSVLTITSNVVYGHATGATPDGRAKGEAFAPGANPMHGRDGEMGALGSLNSVAKVPYYPCCMDGVSNTFSIVPSALGKTDPERVENLVGLLDGYFSRRNDVEDSGGFHLNVNVMRRETLVEAMEHPEKYPSLTIRVSGYAVHFARLTRAQQMEVIARTFHGSM
ncbi:pyruvate formate lyase [Cladochytrium replicatum]|nr:pyruvate formate lyase [Cladochytrium replicatum]